MLEARLLDCLRKRLGSTLAFAERPTALSGGFDTSILAFRLNGAAPEWSQPLILRVMTRADIGARVLREAAVHAAVVAADFPAPRVLLAEADPTPLGRPFMIMQRLPGKTMWAAGGLWSMPRRMAELHTRLHQVGGNALHESAGSLGVDLAAMSIEADLRRLRDRTEREGLRTLLPAIEWLERHRPQPAQPEVVCHGDFHPLNIMVEGDRISGVIDWANATLAEPAYDIAGLRVIALHADLGVRAWARVPENVARELMIRRYMSAYRAATPLDTRNLAYYEAIRILSALIFAREPRIQTGNPWNAPHTVARLIGEFERATGVRVEV